MKRYLILTHYEPSEKARAVHHVVMNWYSGLGDRKMNTMRESRVLTENDADKLDEWLVRKYGYKTFFGARRGLRSAQREADMRNADGVWIETCKIVEVEVNEEN